MAYGKQLDELIQYHKENQDDKVDNVQRDRKHNNVNTNDDVDNCMTQHINDCGGASQRAHPRVHPLSMHA